MNKSKAFAALAVLPAVAAGVGAAPVGALTAESAPGQAASSDAVATGVATAVSPRIADNCASFLDAKLNGDGPDIMDAITGGGCYDEVPDRVDLVVDLYGCKDAPGNPCEYFFSSDPQVDGLVYTGGGTVYRLAHGQRSCFTPSHDSRDDWYGCRSNTAGRSIAAYEFGWGESSITIKDNDQVTYKRSWKYNITFPSTA